MNYRRKTSIYVSAVLVLTLLLTSACVPSSPEQAVEQFFNQTGPEDTLQDPLILGGDGTVPIILEKLKDKKMPRRRYAIAFLGNGSYVQALPALQSILQDATEEDFFRGDALEAIYQIDSSLGTRYAETYKADASYLGDVARRVLLKKGDSFERRSYLQALLGTHK